MVVLYVSNSALAQLTPTSVTASSTFYTYNKDHLIDNSGLSGGLHDTDFHNMWLSDATTTATLVFDLGASYSLNSALVWQYNYDAPDRGVKDLQISISPDGVTFSPVTTTTLTESSGGLIPAQTVAFTAVAGRYVKFDILSNYGDILYVGLSEVKFELGNCGNGVVDETEQCDDGNILNGDCCPSTCQLPTGCKAAGKSLLLLKNDASDDSKDKLVWKWLKGAETMFGDLGDPTSTTNYTLCLYAGTSAASVAIPAGSNWQAAGTTGYKFKDPSGTPSGAQKALLKIGAAGKAKALVKGKGTNLPDTLAPMLPLPVTAQLVNDTNGTCFEAVYDAGGVIKNDAKQFKAKTP